MRLNDTRTGRSRRRGHSDRPGDRPTTLGDSLAPTRASSPTRVSGWSPRPRKTARRPMTTVPIASVARTTSGATAFGTTCLRCATVTRAQRLRGHDVLVFLDFQYLPAYQPGVAGPVDAMKGTCPSTRSNTATIIDSIRRPRNANIMSSGRIITSSPGGCSSSRWHHTPARWRR